MLLRSSPVALAALFCAASGALGQDAKSVPTLGVEYTVWTGSGAPASLDEVWVALDGADVLLVGEEHDDMVGHRLEDLMLQSVANRYDGTSRPGRSVVLSMEMFERDVQYIVDEYLAGLITEQHFLDSARPWEDYQARYRPLVELAKSRGFPLVAANAPRRYVNRVTREGAASLSALPDPAQSFLPPLPYPGPSALYREQWDAIMAEAMAGMPAAADSSGRAYGMSENAIWSQALWDASMGHGITTALDEEPVRVVVHFAGSFHVEKGTGIPERIQDYRPGTRVVSVVMTKTSDPGRFEATDHAGLADFVILTRAPASPHGS